MRRGGTAHLQQYLLPRNTLQGGRLSTDRKKPIRKSLEGRGVVPNILLGNHLSLASVKS
ncbi:UNVERIFIED_ORG: hypothetical protein GGE44_002074 [Rhizobium esperanzae]